MAHQIKTSLESQILSRREGALLLPLLFLDAKASFLCARVFQLRGRGVVGFCTRVELKQNRGSAHRTGQDSCLRQLLARLPDGKLEENVSEILTAI